MSHDNVAHLALQSVPVATNFAADQQEFAIWLDVNPIISAGNRAGA